MKTRVIAAAVLLLVAGPIPAQKLGPVDWIFLVDTSKSMRGVGGTQDVFDEVKASIGTFVRESNDGDTVSIYAFDRDARLHSKMAINAAARKDLHEIVEGLEADGNRTHLGAAIAKGLDRADELRTGSDPSRSRAIVLFTDGREDVRGIENPIRIDATIPRVGDAFIFFVSMGEHELQLDDFAAKTERTSVLKAPSAEAIRQVAREIRARIPPPPPPPKPHAAPVKLVPPTPPPSPFTRVMKILAIAVPLAAIALFWLLQQRKKSRLEGELEILRPATRGEDAFIGLPKLQAHEVALSALLPVDVLAGRDARLFVKRTAGKKKVWIRAEGGPLRINDVETPVSALYDADTIEIGEAKLRFNRVGDERPLEADYTNPGGEP